MKLIKKDGVVLLKAYDIEELEDDVKGEVLDEYLYQEGFNKFYGWSKNEIIEHIQANGYLFTKEGEMLPIMKYMYGNKVVKRTLKIAGEEIEIQIEDKGVKRVKQITIDVELKDDTMRGIESQKVALRYDIERLVGELEYITQVGDLKFYDLTDGYNEGLK